MKWIDGGISKSNLADMAKNGFGNLIKAVVDIQKKIRDIVSELVK